MSLSFRTNGNFIDFVNTDATSLNVETVLMKLHNTSRCIDWSLPEDTTKISFTIDEVKYSNIPISEIDFDGTVMNSQDDFETGITGMFAGLASGGGDSGFAITQTFGSASVTSSGGVRYVGFGIATTSTTESFRQTITPKAGTISALYVRATNNSLGGSEITFRLRINGVDVGSQVSFILGDDSITTNNAAQNVEVVEGDLLSISVVNNTGNIVSLYSIAIVIT